MYASDPITEKDHLYEWNTRFYAQSGTISGRTFYKSGNGHYGMWYVACGMCESNGAWIIGDYEDR